MSVTSPVTVTRIPDPGEPVPAVAVPTVLLMLGGLALWAGSTAMALTGTWPMLVSTVISGVAAYLLFTVSHDAAHHSASSNGLLNRWIGRIATPFFSAHASFSTFRFIHMQHHRFTNHTDGSDPDGYTMAGPVWQRPFRWLTVDVFYAVFYVRRLGTRPRAEKVEVAVQLMIVGAFFTVAIGTGHALDLVLLYVVPQRLAVLWLAFAFDYLPHHGLHLRPSEDKLKTTRNRIGGERWLSPLLLYQNYHLVHHLHPLVPFYRYLQVWRRNEAQYLEGEPALSTVGGRPISAAEYRELRALAEHEHD
jgi:ring-1,2-phenylacetyl-CoA epoxidase subunit PaaE